MKHSDKALRGYVRVQELITANPFRRNEIGTKNMWNKKSNVSNYINRRISALIGGREEREGRGN